MVLFADTACEA